ncbi:MAG: hypothetical protein ACOYOA_00760 [Saprospiraceae bacterium]|jgi:hypothetical protein
MKKITMIFVVAVFGISSIQAQSENFKNVVSLTAGYSLFNVLGKGASQDVAQGATYNASPTLQASYDYGFGNVFSLGGAVSFNEAKTQATNYEWTDAAGNLTYGDYDVKVARTTIGLRALFHYGNKGRLDMYSGVRLGVGIWSLKYSSTNPSFDPDNEIKGLRGSGALPQFQIIPFALRGYITDNIGLGFETAIGSPYMASLSLNYRFGAGAPKK